MINISYNDENKYGSYLVEGNIGAGKSTFLKKLETLPINPRVIYEPVQLWTNFEGHNYLQLFYDNTRKWTFAFQQLAINTSANEYKKYAKEPGNKFFERSIFSPLKIFAYKQYLDGVLTKPEYDLHKKITSDLVKWIDYDIKGIIYIRTSPQIAQKRCISRQRKEDSTLPMEYLEALHELHEQWLGSKSSDIPVLIYNNDTTVTVNNFNSVSQEIVDWIKNPTNLEIKPTEYELKKDEEQELINQFSLQKV